MERSDKDKLNTQLVEVLNETLKTLESDYKEVANILYYSDNAYINRVLNNKKTMTIATLTNICNAFLEINDKKKSKIDPKKLKPSYFLSRIGL